MAYPSAVLSLCLGPTFVVLSKTVHSLNLKLGTLSDIHIATRILGAYCKCGAVDYACQLFDEIALLPFLMDVMSWNTIISGCIHNERNVEAFSYFKHMLRNSDEGKGLVPDSYTLSSLLSSSHCLGNNVNTGKQLHGYAIKTGIISGVSVGNALITLYANWGHTSESKLVFQSMPQLNVVSWTALISGYAQNISDKEEAVQLFVQMVREERPNQFTWASLFSLFADSAWLMQGICFISLALKMGFLSFLHVQNSLVGFFADCGCLEEAKATFDVILAPDIVSWNSLLKGYSQLGLGDEALHVFKEMCNKGSKPDSITFLLVLSACSHSGKTSHGLALYRKMEEDYNIEPRTEHVSCIVNLLGRAGKIGEAVEFIQNVRCQLGSSVWRTLLGACRAHGDSQELAEMAAKELLLLEPYDAEAFIVLSHIYAASGRWNRVRHLRQKMKEKGVEKEPGFSLIQVNHRVHTFVAADWAHPCIYEIVTSVIELTNNIKDEDEFNSLDYCGVDRKRYNGQSGSAKKRRRVLRVIQVQSILSPLESETREIILGNISADKGVELKHKETRTCLFSVSISGLSFGCLGKSKTVGLSLSGIELQ
ncbi:pentatricopeptide repeat-containing protein At3g24000, mitochondrial-like [Aristolochia californica]|uniref:pentatricopeptide repeat-containing protein At3g24000, mitochondrial-like n=1 Tax=Aristolochia californica TaxID=171875 RepID=UPI0035D9231A